jgi:hypothetical protein
MLDRSRQVRLGFVALGFLLLALPGAALAQFVDEEPVGRLTIGGTLGVVTSSMSDINDNLSVLDRTFTADEIRATDKINASLLSALDVRYRLTDWLSLGVQWGALQNRSEFNTTRLDQRFFSRATTYGINAYYHFQGVTDWNERLQVYVGGGFLLLRNGTIEFAVEDKTTNNFRYDSEPPEWGDLAEFSGAAKAEADGAGFNLVVGSSYQLSGSFSVAMDLGYRLAKMSDLTVTEIEGFEAGNDWALERFASSDTQQPREPGDWALWDFFLRDPNATLPDGRNRTDAKDPDNAGTTGCADCPLYYGSGGAVEIDYSGFVAALSFRLHFF